MANRQQDDRSGRNRGGGRGWDDDNERRDDEGRGNYGRDTNEQSGSTGRYAGYGNWGQGNYDNPNRGNTGQDRYGQSGYGGSRDQGSGYGEQNYGRDENRQGGSRGSDSGYGYGGYGAESRSQRGWAEPSGEGQQYGSQRGWDRGGSQSSGSQSGGYRSGSGQSSGYGGPTTGSEFGGSSQSDSSQYGYGSSGQGPHRGKGPKGYQRSDERTKELISERLRDDPNIDASEITITVSGGKVTLDGTVDSRQAKNHAEDLAEHCGCDDVQNNLRVQRSQESSSMSGTAKASSGADRDKGESTRQRH